MLKYTIEAKVRSGRARAGMIETAHGNIPTPAFIPVATKATIKSLTPEMVRDAVGADAILANTYHLYLQPGTDILEKAGGLGKFMNWPGPTFTDSGGFQAFSLGTSKNRATKIATQSNNNSQRTVSENADLILEKVMVDQIMTDHSQTLRDLNDLQNVETNNSEIISMAKVSDEGVSFRSIIDGSSHMFTPERSIEIQHKIGADIIFAFDECILPGESYERQKQAVARTNDWAKRCLVKRLARDISGKIPRLNWLPALFGIVQGGRYEDLRRASARCIGAMDFDGFGIGGSFDKEDIGTAVGWVCDELPQDRPRHLLGIGSEPIDLILGIENGIDTFDCVAPARIARNGSAYISKIFHPGISSNMKLSDLSSAGLNSQHRSGNSASLKESEISRGKINLLNARFTTDFSPIDPSCACYTCKNYSRAYLAHLFRAKEMLAATLTTIHNLYFVVHLVKDARQAIIEGSFNEFKSRFI